MSYCSVELTAVVRTPASGLQGCERLAVLCLSQKKEPFLHSELMVRAT